MRDTAKEKNRMLGFNLTGDKFKAGDIKKIAFGNNFNVQFSQWYLMFYTFLYQDNELIVNGRVYACSGGDAQDKPLLLLLKRLLMQRLSLPYLITPLKWVNEEASNDKYYADNTKTDSQYRREFFKEITCQTNGKNGYSQIKHCPGDKLSARFINNGIHHNNFYHILRYLSRRKLDLAKKV